MNTVTPTPTAPPGGTETPPAAPEAVSRGTPNGVFVALALATVGLFALLNWMIAAHAPFGVKGIGASYLIMYYHVPSAAVMLLGYVALGVCGVFYLVTGSRAWDRRGRVSASIALLANGVVLLTGMVWGKAAWNIWWRFDDPKLTTAAVVFLIYLGYVVLQRGIDDELKRPRICAIYGVLASPSYVLVKYSVEWFGTGSHPPQVDLKDPGIRDTFLMAHLAFLAFYVLLWLRKLDVEALHDRAEAALMRIRRLEDSRS